MQTALEHGCAQSRSLREQIGASAAALLEFPAPYLIEKLCNLGLVADAHQGEALFLEVKRYLLLAAEQERRPLPMFSVRVDEVWHQFILFTREYHEFCDRFAGCYLHHSPRESAPDESAPPLSFEEFGAAYAERFGPLSSLWRDELLLAPDTRLARARAGEALAVRCAGGWAELVRGAEPAALLCRASARAQAALGFIAAQRQFLLRELPGLASDAERISLVQPLVRYGILRVAP
jgi:hypothetical protein